MSPSRCVLNSYTSHPCLLMIHLYLDVITNLVCQENFENCCYLVTSQCRLALMVTYVQHPFSEAPVIIQSHLMFLSYLLSTSPPLRAAYHVSSNHHPPQMGPNWMIYSHSVPVLGHQFRPRQPETTLTSVVAIYVNCKNHRIIRIDLLYDVYPP